MAEFRTFRIEASFDELTASVRFEDVAKGRRAAVLVKPSERGIPIVRTTTVYASPAQRFGALHERLAREILPGSNNALVEHYTSAYSSMKRHSDQALDLVSSIAVLSCYRDPGNPTRRLVVKAKQGDEAFDIPLLHGGVVAFSLETNRRFTHAIAPSSKADNDWFGITFRTSKTFVRDGAIDGVPLTLATEEQRREFFQLRRRENDELDFTYPPIAYTLSPSDLMAMASEQ